MSVSRTSVAHVAGLQLFAGGSAHGLEGGRMRDEVVLRVRHPGGESTPSAPRGYGYQHVLVQTGVRLHDVRPVDELEHAALEVLGDGDGDA